MLSIIPHSSLFCKNFSKIHLIYIAEKPNSATTQNLLFRKKSYNDPKVPEEQFPGILKCFDDFGFFHIILPLQHVYFFIVFMFKFFKEAFQELEHVVWPTPKETRKYMNYNIGVIIVMTLFLMALGLIFRESLTTVRGFFPHTAITTDDQPMTQEDLDKLLEQWGVSGSTQTGEISTDTGTAVNVLSGANISADVLPENIESNDHSPEETTPIAQ